MSNPPGYDSLRARLAADAAFLPDKPEETPDSTLRALWHLAAGTPASAERAMTLDLPALDATQLATLEQFVERRLGGAPLAHITQRQRFMGLEMLAGSAALVPRRETELLAHTAITCAEHIAGRAGQYTVVDICTGSGNVALAMANALPSAKVFGSDLSAEAVELAQRNAEHLQLSNRAQFRIGDLLQPFENEQFLRKVDVLTCNPPYINSAGVARMATEISSHEPRLAFDGGPLGISILMRLLSQAPQFVRPGGWLAFEVGLGQGPALMKRMQANAAFQAVTPTHDAAGAIRVLSAMLIDHR